MVTNYYWIFVIVSILVTETYKKVETLTNRPFVLKTFKFVLTSFSIPRPFLLRNRKKQNKNKLTTFIPEIMSDLMALHHKQDK